MLLQKICFALLLSLLLPLSTTLAQEERTEQDDKTEVILSVKIKKGNTLIGKQLAWTDTHIVLEVEGIGKVNISLDEVDQVQIINDNYTDGEYWIPMVRTPQLLFSPSGYGPKRSEIYYRNTLLILNQFDFGVTDYFSVGILFELVSPLFEQQTPVIAITPRFTIPIEKDKVNIGVGGYLFGAPNTGRLIDLSIINGVVTYGTIDRNFSVGVGWAIIEGEFSSNPGITLSGIYRFNNGIAILTDNYFIAPDDVAVGSFSLGVRLIRKNVSWDFSLLFVDELEEQFDTENRFVPSASFIVPIN
ncbi:MAG: hypothetical protein AAF798_12595 [Bacteroidota bacterium]